MRWYNQQADETDFEKRHRQGFIDVHHFLNLDGDEGDNGKKKGQQHPKRGHLLMGTQERAKSRKPPRGPMDHLGGRQATHLRGAP